MLDSFSKDISLRLDDVRRLIRSKNPNLVLSAYSLIESIKKQASSIVDFPSNILKRIESIREEIIELVPEWIEEIVADFLEVWESEVFIEEWEVIIFHGDSASVITCNKTEKYILSKLIEQKNKLSINPESINNLITYIDSLNAKFNAYWLFFGIRDWIFSCSDSTFENQETRIIDEHNFTAQVIFETKIFFWSDNNHHVWIKIYTPKKVRNTAEVKVEIWKQALIFTPATLEYFLDIIQSWEVWSRARSYAISQKLNSILRDTCLELIRTPWKNERLSLRTSKLTDIKYLTPSDYIVPTLDDILSQSQKVKTTNIQNNSEITETHWDDIPEKEKLFWEISWMQVATLKSEWAWKYMKFHIKVWEEIVLLSPKQNELFLIFFHALEWTVSLTPAEYQTYMALKKIIAELWHGEQILWFVESRRKFQKSKKQVWEKSKSTNQTHTVKKISETKKAETKWKPNTTIEELSEDEWWEFYDNWILYRMTGKSTRWAHTSYYLSNITNPKTESIKISRAEKDLLSFLISAKWVPRKLWKLLAPALPTLRKKLPVWMIKNERGEWYYIGTYAHQEISWVPRYSQSRIIWNPLNESDYAVEENIWLNTKLQAFFWNNPGSLYTIEEISRALGSNIELQEFQTQFLLAKAQINNPRPRIFESNDGKWGTIPNDISKYTQKIWDTEVIYIDYFWLFLRTDWEFIFQSKHIWEFFTVKYWKLRTIRLWNVSLQWKHLWNCIDKIRLYFPHLIFKLDGSITTRFEQEKNT